MSVAKISYRHYGDKFQNVIVWATYHDMIGQGETMVFRCRTASLNNRRKIKKLVLKKMQNADFVQFF